MTLSKEISEKVLAKLLALGFTDERIQKMSDQELDIWVEAVIKEYGYSDSNVAERGEQ